MGFFQAPAIQHKTPASEILANNTNEKKFVMRHCCGSPVYRTFLGYLIKSKVYGEAVMADTVADVPKWVIKGIYYMKYKK